jgi:hypothetical protein
VSAHTGEGLERRLGRALSSAARSLGVAAAARERERRKENEARVTRARRSVVLFGRKPRATVGLRWTAHRHRTEIQPRRGESFPAQAQVAAWSAGRTERERAGGPFLGFGPFPGRERGVFSREWAAGRFFGFGPFFGQARAVIFARAGREPIPFTGRIS